MESMLIYDGEHVHWLEKKKAEPGDTVYKDGEFGDYWLIEKFTYAPPADVLVYSTDPELYDHPGRHKKVERLYPVKCNKCGMVGFSNRHEATCANSIPFRTAGICAGSLVYHSEVTPEEINEVIKRQDI